MVIMSSFRLGPCEICSASVVREDGPAEAIYTCPRCSVKTCSLQCVKEHKERTECSGIRDRTRYKPKDKLTEEDFLQDYYLLEELSRGVDAFSRDKLKSETFKNQERFLPNRLACLQRVCRRNKMKLFFLPPSFKQHQDNSSMYKPKGSTIYWRLDLVFPHCKKTIELQRVSENIVLGDLLAKYLEVSGPGGELQGDPFREYKAVGFGGVRVLLKNQAGPTQKHYQRFHELDCKKSIRKNLFKKTVIEYPVIFVTFSTHKDYFSTDIQENEFYSDFAPPPQMQGRDVTSELSSPSEANIKAEQSDSDDTNLYQDTFGLFAAAEDYSSEDEASSPKRQRLQPNNVNSNSADLSVKQEEAQFSRDHDSSFETGQVPQEADKAYSKYYDYYLRYYQNKYGVSDEAQIPAQDDADSGPAKSSALTSLVGYGSESSEGE